MNDFGYKLAVDGIFGANTQRAVRDFQSNNSLSVDGIVGNNTWRTLLTLSPYPLLRQGARGSYVRFAQQLLESKFIPVGGIDGIFGAKTKNAVQAFQKENGLEADGIIGPLTWAKLATT